MPRRRRAALPRPRRAWLTPPSVGVRIRSSRLSGCPSRSCLSTLKLKFKHASRQHTQHTASKEVVEAVEVVAEVEEVEEVVRRWRGAARAP